MVRSSVRSQTSHAKVWSSPPNSSSGGSGRVQVSRSAPAGWPAATRLAVEALRGVAPGERVLALERLRRPGGRLFTYLEEEVFALEPECSRELLRHLAVCQEADLSLCRALGFEDAATLLAALTRRGLVRFTPGPQDSWSLIRPLRDFVERGPSLAPRLQRWS